MSQPDQPFGQVKNYSLGSAIQFGWNAFVQRRDLSNTQDSPVTTVRNAQHSVARRSTNSHRLKRAANQEKCPRTGQVDFTFCEADCGGYFLDIFSTALLSLSFVLLGLVGQFSPSYA